MGTIIVGALVIGLFIGVFIYVINKKKKTGSAGACSGCTGCNGSCTLK